MKEALLVLVFGALSLFCHAQFEFTPDSIEQRNQRDIAAIDAMYQVSGEGDFQLMFWMLPGQENRRTLLVLTNNKQKWQARYFEREKAKGGLAWKELPIFQEGIDTLWDGLQENDVLHIRNSVELRDADGRAAFHPLEGGVLYFFELRGKNGKRAYYYHCPKHQQQRYQHKEFSRVVNMIQLLNNFTKEKQKPIC